MALERKDVEHVARLARLELSEEEFALYTRQLGDILGYVEQLNEVNVEDVEPLAHGAHGANVFRNDEVKPSLDRDRALDAAPDDDGRHFRVPKVIDTGEGH
ncbi:MAG: Asp-tRNA(Asn)/Glu-tRNA(Gln) amidotransferase subunit GatC [Planctomycetota bacterium]|jgi:aspartyl-tRNA(Asn)/glutamyl-tRNA(Gln) amidotransferase subunit C